MKALAPNEAACTARVYALHESCKKSAQKSGSAAARSLGDRGCARRRTNLLAVMMATMPRAKFMGSNCTGPNYPRRTQPVIGCVRTAHLLSSTPITFALTQESL